MQCFASNAYGVALSNVTQVTQIALSFVGHITNPAESFDIGVPITFPCNTAAFATAVPSAVIQWQLVPNLLSTAAIPVALNQRVQMDETGKGSSIYYVTLFGDI